MLVQDINDKINKVVNKVFNYINLNLNLKKDLDDYYKTTGVAKDNKRAFNNYTLNYLFERRIGTDKKTIFDFALADMHDLTEDDKNILLSLKNSIEGIFEVRKITHEKFEIFNIINEKTYIVTPMAKMVMFRNLSVGHFVIARLVTFENEYYMYHISDHITYSNRVLAFQIAISRLVQDPSLFYYDNPEKFEQLKANSENLEKKFHEVFSTNCVITSNKFADELVELLNDYIENDEKPSDKSVAKYIKPCKNDEYFDIRELNTGSNLLVSAKKGFSAQDKEYNVALLADNKTGLQVVPFMDIFMDIFEKENYTEIKNYKECVKKFVEEKQIAPLALQIASEKYPETFLARINEIMETQFTSLGDILTKYKKFYIDNPYTSSTLTLYSSYAFKRLMDVTDVDAEEKSKFKKVGRNDPCPCGSGLKYKKCCGMAVQI